MQQAVVITELALNSANIQQNNNMLTDLPTV